MNFKFVYVQNVIRKYVNKILNLTILRNEIVPTIFHN